uniref:adenine phosphoribosyltransferase n=1 Tax=Kalanchoe fedtschenkoi TaxID=63787 RepID=A0A7N0SV48_KALFE
MFAEENGLRGDPRLRVISESIRVIPDFPKPGIMFQDISTLLLNHKAFKHTVDIFVDRYKDMNISAVAGCEARGFMFGTPIALAIGAKFIPLRKPGKLPGETISEAYDLEYGKDCLEMHVGAVQPEDRVLIIDDLVATGGTLSASIRLIERMGADVIECACVVGLTDFKKDRKLNGKPLYILIEPRLEVTSKSSERVVDSKNGTSCEFGSLSGTTAKAGVKSCNCGEPAGYMKDTNVEV